MVVETLVGLVFVGFGLVAVGAGGLKVRDAVRIWRSDPVPVREVAEATGTDEFEGTVRSIDGETFDAPFAGEEAVLATYRVERRESNSSNDRGSNSSWKTVTSGEITRPFLVEDATGTVEVDPAGAEISPANEETKTTESTALPDDVRLRLSVLTDEFDLEGVLPQKTSRRRRFSEGHVSPGDSVHVYGTQLAERTPADSQIDARVENSETDSLYQISAGDEWTAVRRNALAGVALVLVGLAFAGFGTAPVLASVL